MSEICTICGGQFSNLGVHLNKKHHITREEYDKDNMKESLPEGASIVKDDESEDIFEATETVTTEEPSVTTTENKDGLVNKDQISEAKSTPVTPKMQEEAIFGETPDNRDKPLGDFLDEFELEEKELRSIVREYLRKGFVPIDQKTRIVQNQGKKEAERLKNEIGEVRVTSLVVAESLVKDFGFTCLGIEPQKGITPKTWVLKKE